MKKFPLNTAIIGMGGFASAHHNAVYELEKSGILKLLCTCDIEIEKFQQMIERLKMKERNVEIFSNYLDMLERFKEKLDFVTIPTPIHLHAEMHKECVKRTLSVYLEKPPTLDYQELMEMINLDSQAIKKTSVGFNFIIQKLRHKIKERILSGEFGKINKISFLGMWPRTLSYFNRSAWAGKLMLNEKIVLDSCFGNAISHYVHNILFWCGKNGILSWDPVEQVQAEIYRANRIQGTDTVFVIASTKNVKDIRIALTHACESKTDDIEKIYCDNAEIHFEGNAKADESTQAKCEIYWKKGKKELICEHNNNLLLENIHYYARYICEEESRPLIRLEDTEPFVMLNGLIYIAAKQIHSIPEDYLKIVKTENQDTLIGIKGIQEIAEKFINTAMFPSQQNVAWAKKGGNAKNHEISSLRQVVKSML